MIDLLQLKSWSCQKKQEYTGYSGLLLASMHEVLPVNLQLKSILLVLTVCLMTTISHFCIFCIQGAKLYLLSLTNSSPGFLKVF